jgi:hypothetical protein
VPLKKPKSAPLPAPFKDIAASGDEDKIMAARVIKRELDAAEGFSWNAKAEAPKGPLGHLRAIPAHRKWFALASLGMGGVIILAFIIAAGTGFVKPEPGPIYFDSWEEGRTSEDALKDKEERMADLRAAYAAHNARIDAQQAQAEAARQAGLEAERRAARGATSE